MAAKKESPSKRAEIKQGIVKNVTGLMTAAFGLVAALAWNSAIQKLFTIVFGTQGGLYAMVGYALVVTVIAVIVTVYLGRLAGKLGI
ncbi:MAG: hypothetical protein KGH94_03035 [Candidatus Micrarchaeota archaeon]|nr:hypothetical protein [Candidatus Micrarchaeota archaeon]